FQEAIFSNLTVQNFLEQVNKKKAAAFSSTTFSSTGSLPISTEDSAKQINKRKKEAEQYTGKDHLEVNNNDLSVATIIKRAAMKKHINYESLNPSDIALVEPALRKIDNVFKGVSGMQKDYQRKAPKLNEKMGYELVWLM
ncbi:hypothetical protein BD408DRAFT_351273, partial [Parasitella parasitica]